MNAAELTKEVLHLLDRLEVKPRIRSRRPLVGRHRSRLSGSSPDFVEFRDYQSGENARDIDWRASQKRDRLLVRRREHLGMLEHWLVADASASMSFPDPEHSKHRAQILLAGALLYLLGGQGDSAGLCLAGEGDASFEPAKTSPAHARMIAHLAALAPAGQAGLAAFLGRLRERLRGPACLWIFSDFDAAPEDTCAAIRVLAEDGHDVRVLHLFHPAERELSWRGECRFTDPEGAIADLLFRPETIAAEYAAEWELHCAGIHAELSGAGVLVSRIDVTAPLQTALLQILGAGE